MLHETDPAKQRALMRQFEKYVLDDQAHEIWLLWWYRIVPYRSYVKGCKIAPTHFINQDLAPDLAGQMMEHGEHVAALEAGLQAADGRPQDEGFSC